MFRPITWTRAFTVVFLLAAAAVAFGSEEEVPVAAATAVEPPWTMLEKLATERLLDLSTFPVERERYGTSLDEIIDLYRRHAFIDMQVAVTRLFVADPAAREDELPRMLEAEALYFNGGPRNLELRVRFSKRTYQDLLTRFPNSPRNDLKLFRLGSILFLQNYEPEAVGLLSYLVDEYPDSELARPARLLEAEILVKSADIARAVRDYRFVADDPEAEDEEVFVALTGLAVAHALQSDEKRAIKIFQELAPLPEDRARLDEKAMHHYGTLLEFYREFDKALTVYAEFLERFPLSAERGQVMFRSAGILQAQGRMDNALGAWRRVFEEMPDEEWGYASALMIADTLSTGPETWNDEAWSLYERVMGASLYPQWSHRAQQGASNMLIRDGRYRDALKLLDDLWARPLTPAQKGACLDAFATAFDRHIEQEYRARRYDRICESFFEYVDLAFSRRLKPETFDRVVEAYYENHLYDSLYTIAVSVTALRLFPVRAQFARGLAEEGRGHPDEALAVFTELQRVDPLGHIGRRASIERVRLEAGRGRFWSTIEAADEALSLAHTATDRAELLIIRSQARLETGDTITSVEGFRQSVDLLLPASTARERGLLADALYGLGRALVSTDQPVRAKPVLEAAVGAFPADARAGLAIHYLKRLRVDPVPTATLDGYWKALLEQMGRVDDWRQQNKIWVDGEAAG